MTMVSSPWGELPLYEGTETLYMHPDGEFRTYPSTVITPYGVATTFTPETYVSPNQDTKLDFGNLGSFFSGLGWGGALAIGALLYFMVKK